MIELSRLAELFAVHAPSLTLYARQLSNEPDDLVQESFVRLMNLANEPPNVRAWLMKTLRNLSIDRRRSLFRRRRRETKSATAAAWFQPAVATTIDGDHVASLLATLPARQREVIVLRLWSGLTFAEIAAVVGVSDSTVHDDYHAAIHTLRVRLESPCKPTR